MNVYDLKNNSLRLLDDNDTSVCLQKILAQNLANRLSLELASSDQMQDEALTKEELKSLLQSLRQSKLDKFDHRSLHPWRQLPE